jgi:nicotinamide-nucleotide adenylyltransferase
MGVKGIFVGRLQPLHNGHVKQIHRIIRKFGADNTLIVIGSTQEWGTEKNPFPYRLRYRWVTSEFPMANVIGVPDFVNDDRSWLAYLQDMFRLTWGDGPILPVFHIGDESEAGVYRQLGIDPFIMQRSGISGTEVRERLSVGDRITGLVPPVVEASAPQAYVHFNMTRNQYLRRNP